MKTIKSVFNFYILCVQPLLGLFLVGYSIWSFSGEGILIGTIVLFVWYIAWQTERSKEEDFKLSIKPEDFVK
ncbi:hypothetical protein B5N23_003990 [Escherichia coli]|uniref:hypothetical protein n=1 Tax=Escherichia coli TaxID=562 RepID=UPI0017DE9240|nr:hypothetical protein [Escherichia coli]EFF4703700.1 hypothetical protein [Escherichia coli]EHL0086663.1 hypothetical protein [Escherichia coli]EHL1428468.1 hypothetical protein [Escherichia coli]MCX9252706.1 hypothetical protein [Escherichia coli]